jgi:CHAD domain-containing protein
MAEQREVEVERTFEVDGATVLPDLVGTGPVARVAPPVQHDLEAVYFDTADLALARRGITLRRRTGGDDAGWHLKLPADGDARTEVRRPLGKAVRTVPTAVRAPVRSVVRDHPLVPVARIVTRRRERDLLAFDGTVLARLCDDEVEATRLVGETDLRRWREWELELDEGDPELLDAVAFSLAESGAETSGHGSKLLRVLGDAVPADVAPGHGYPEGSVARVLLGALAEQVDQLLAQDPRVRRDEPDAVHQLRVAARRLRSLLKTYGPLLDDPRVEGMRQDLRWLGQVAGAARDAEVLSERLHARVAHEDVTLVLGPVRRRLDTELRRTRREGQAATVRALDSERWFRLLDDLEDLVGDPHMTPEAQQPAPEALPRLLRRDTKRLRRAMRRAEEAAGSPAYETTLHEVRKKAKRLRYGAESMRQALGKKAKRRARDAKQVQRVLGRQHDTVIARGWLRELGVRAYMAGENGFTFGRWHAQEETRSRQEIAEYDELQSRLSL